MDAQCMTEPGTSPDSDSFNTVRICTADTQRRVTFTQLNRMLQLIK